MEKLDLTELFRFICESLDEVRTKLSMENNTTQIRNSRFYLPNYPLDIIQKCIVQSNDYWDIEALRLIDKYLKDEAVILDIGANIGNHTIYWGVERHAKKIYSFEPLKGSYGILLKNIELNDLQNKVVPYNFGLSDEETSASVKTFLSSNIGGTSFQKDGKGQFKFRTLDSLEFSEKIDLIKIDVEWHEFEVLMGAVKTINKHKPVIAIESFNRKAEIDTIFKELGYEQVETIREGEDYIYKWAGK